MGCVETEIFQNSISRRAPNQLHPGCLPGLLPVGLPQGQTASLGSQPESLAITRSVRPHPNGGGLVPTSPGRMHLPGTHHPARAGSSRAHRSTPLATSQTAAAEDLQDPGRKCVDNLSRFEPSPTETDPCEIQKNAKVGLNRRMAA